MRQARIKKMAAWRSKASSRLSSRNSEVASQSGGHAAEQQSASHRSSSQAGGHVQGGERLHVDTAATAGDDASTPLWDRSGTPGESRGTARETDLPLTTPSETTGLTRGRHTPGTPSDANFGGATSGLSPDNADSGRHDGASQLSPTGGSTSLHKWGSQHGRGSSKASAEDPVSPPGVFTQASLAAWGDQGLGVRAAAAHAPEPTPQEELRSLPEPSKAESPAAAAPAVRASLGTRIDAWIDAALFVAAPRSAAASRPLCAPEAAARLLLHAVATAHAPAAAAAQVVAALRARAGLAGADLPALVWVYVVAVRVRQGLPFAASGAGNGAAALKVERECFSALAAALFAQTLRVHADTDAPWVSRVEGWGAALRGAQTTLRRACAAVLPAAQSTAEAARLARPIQLVLLRLVDAVLLNTTLALPVPGSLSAGSGSAVAAAVRDAALACSGRDLHPDYQAAASKLPELPKDGALTFGWGMESKMGLSTVLEAVGADPAAGNSVLPLMRSVADLLMVPKDLLADPSTRREVCPHLTTDQVAAVLERYHPDCYCADPVDPGILDAIIAPRTGGDGGAVELRRIIEDVAYDAPGADADAAPAWLAGGQRAVDTDVGVLLRAGGGVCGAHGTPAKDVLRAVQAPDDGPAKEEPPPRTAPAIGPRPVRRRAPPVADSAGAGNGAAAAGAAAGPTEERAWWRGVGARGRAAAQRRQQGAGAGGGGDGFSFAQGDAAQVAVDLT
ncbi:unnamed protein product [Pedinophyceae sp. YPF-701]|nr:unnamed protein product [Pedinophyceae sp. YPF-701]